MKLAICPHCHNKFRFSDWNYATRDYLGKVSITALGAGIGDKNNQYYCPECGGMSTGDIFLPIDTDRLTQGVGKLFIVKVVHDKHSHELLGFARPVDPKQLQVYMMNYEKVCDINNVDMSEYTFVDYLNHLGVNVGYIHVNLEIEWGGLYVFDKDTQSWVNQG